jgi:quercetin dioxygenase-like cupin family protein
MTTDDRGYLLPPDAGQAIWFLGTLMTVKAGKDETNGAFTLIEQLAPAGFAPPPHIHRTEDEAFYILEGEITVTCGEHVWSAAAGAFVFLPRGVPHTFAVADAGPARLLQLTTPGQFERFAAEAGEPAAQPVLPEPSTPDVPRLLALMAKYGYDPVGPPPGD